MTKQTNKKHNFRKGLALVLVGMTALTTVPMSVAAASLPVEVTSSSVASINKLSTSLTLGVGEAYFTEQGTYKSSNSSVASIDSNGTITAKKIGTTTITGKTARGSQVSCKLTVKAAPTSIKLNTSNFTLGVGESFTIAESTNSGSYAKAFTWSSSNSAVATITKGSANKATIKAVGVGTTTISVTTYNGKTASLTLTVKAAPQSVNLNTGNFTLGVGEKFTIAESTNSGSYAKAFTWSSSNSSVATIAKDKANKAIITANKVGTTNITIKTYNGVTKTIKLTVKKAPTSVTINTGNFTLGVGEKFEIKQNSPSDCYAKGFTWSSSNSSVATVTKGSANRAEVVAKKVGTANITIRTYNGKTATIKVSVKKAPTSVKINTGNLTLDIGKTAEIKQNSPSDCYAKEFTWSSSNPSVATVTKGSANKATVKAVSAGTANITITTYNGKTATIKVTVNGAQKPTDPVTDPTEPPTTPPTDPVTPTEPPTEKVWIVDEPEQVIHRPAYQELGGQMCNDCGLMMICTFFENENSNGYLFNSDLELVMKGDWKTVDKAFDDDGFNHIYTGGVGAYHSVVFWCEMSEDNTSIVRVVPKEESNHWSYSDYWEDCTTIEGIDRLGEKVTLRYIPPKTTIIPEQGHWEYREVK